MADGRFAGVKYLAFDIFGTVMDLTGSLTGPVGNFLAAHGSRMTGEAFYADWRDRQRIEQYQDNLLMLGHSGYLETCRRAFVYCLKKHKVSHTDEAVREFMETYERLRPFDDAIQGLRMLSEALQAGGTLQWGTVVPGGAAAQQRPDNVRRHHIGGPGWRIQAVPGDLPESRTAAGMRAG